MMFMDLTLRMVLVYAMPEPAKVHAIEAITEALQAGKLQHRIAHNVTLDQISEGHKLVEQGGFGGCVIVSTE
jgi:NADPH2:quinone reductase